MSRNRRQGNDYGEKWAVAVALMDEPCGIDEVEEHFSKIARRFGFFNIDPLIKKHNKQSLKQFIEETLLNMQELGWVLKNEELYELTEKGREEAQKAYDDNERAGKMMKKAFTASMASKVTFIVHLVLAVIKLPAALLSGSVGLLSDSLDTLADALSSLFVWVGVRKHKEELANKVLVALMLLTGGFTLYKATARIFNPTVPQVDTFTFTAAIVSALLCGVLWMYQRYTGKKTKTAAIITQSVDSRNHVFAALSVTAGLVAAKLNFAWLDISVGLVVAILICKSAIELLIDMIKRANGEETQINTGRFAVYKHREYRKWMLSTIKDNDFATEEELVSNVKQMLDTTGNRTLKAFDKDTYSEMDSTIAECIKSLKADGYIKIDGSVRVTEKGEKYAMDLHKRKEKRSSHPIKKATLIIWYSVEFVLIYLLLRYLSDLIGLQMLQDNMSIFSLFGMSFGLSSIITLAAGLVLYLFGRYNFGKITKLHQNIEEGELLTTGLYEKVRHPMYGMMITMQVGVFSAVCYWWSAIFSVILFAVICFNSWFEEKALVRSFEDKYVEYKKTTTNRLLPKGQMVFVIVVVLSNIARALGLY